MTGTERKVFQKYYPPDFDPAKIPKAKQPRNRQFIQRVMTPFNMRCNTCNEYIYKGKKFNMRRETAEGENYLGLKIFRFYFRCPNCLAEITFKTDIENVDYQAEHGATRLFDAFKFYQEQERREEVKEEEEKADAMKMLEKRTKMSKIEMEALGHIEELQESNRRYEKIDAIAYINETEQQRAMSFADQIRVQEEEDEREVERLVGRANGGKIERRLNDDEKGEGDNLPTSSSSSSAPAPIIFAKPSERGTTTTVKTQQNPVEMVVPMPSSSKPRTLSSSSSLSSLALAGAGAAIGSRKNKQAALLGGMIVKKKK